MTFNATAACITARLTCEEKTTEIKAYYKLSNGAPLARAVQDICAAVGGRVVYFYGIRNDGSTGAVVPVADRRTTAFSSSTLARAVENLLKEFPAAAVRGADRRVHVLEISSSATGIAQEESEGAPGAPSETVVLVDGIRSEF